MISNESRSVISRSKSLYAEKLQEELESKFHGQFVAIEPDSGEYFVAATFDDAVSSAKAQHPDKLSHTIRIGHAGAFSIGVLHS